MMRNLIRKITALVLMMAMCLGLCTKLEVNALENDDGTMKEQTEQTEPVASEENYAEEPEEQEKNTGQVEEGVEKTESMLNSKSSASELHAPRIEVDSSMEAGQKVTWDCVWFGSYPQSEVESSEPIYSTLQSTGGWDNNDITIGGNRYRRMKKEDATYAASSNDYYYDWQDADYHYFKYEPVKWRVLKTDGNQALLLSDVALDDQRYNTVYKSVTWETSTIRSWLNGYGFSCNQQGIDYSGRSFIDRAFTSGERSAIADTSVVNADNLSYGTEGGKDAVDKIFLLPESEVYGENAVPYGFASESDTEDEARRSKSSTYAKAMGVWSDTYEGSCHWWLRTPGRSSLNAANVDNYGFAGSYGYNVHHYDVGVRAALNLNLSSSQWSYAGTVCSDEDENSEGGDEEETPETGYNVEWTLDEQGILTISGQGPIRGFETYEEEEWNSPMIKNSIKSVVIEEGITEIGENAFRNCENLESIKVSAGVTKIGDSVFENCEKLTEVALPDSMSTIEKEAFKNCKSLKIITLPNGVKTVKDSAFSECMSMTDIMIPDSVISLGEDIFAGCDSLKNIEVGVGNPFYASEDGVLFNQDKSYLIKYPVKKADDIYNIPKGVKGIADEAFRDCKYLKTVRMPEQVTEIGSAAFFACESLMDITIPSGITQIADRVFYGCVSLKNITIPDSVTSIDRSAFKDCKTLTDIIIPGKVKEIGDHVFMGCTGLENVVIPDNTIKKIENGLFSNCSNLKSIIISNGVTWIDYGAFSGCSSLTHIVIPEGVTRIDEIAFSFCSSLTDIVIPNSVTVIFPGAFGACTALKTIRFEGNAPNYIYEAFGDVTAVAYYPSNNNTWTKEKFQDYGGKLTWKSYLPEDKDTPTDTDKKQVLISKITISGFSKKIAAGKKVKLSASITPSNASNKKIEWSSSNPKVAGVSASGVVTMKKKSGGKSVIITATALDGSNKKASYKITSMKGIVKKIAISGKKSVKAGKSLKLKAKVTASKKANKKLKWTSSNPKYATVNNAGTVKTYKAGKKKKVKITAQATDGSGKKKTITIKIQ